MRTLLFICAGAGIALLVACKSTLSTASPEPKPKPATTELTTAVDKARQQLQDLNATAIALTAKLIEQQNLLLSLPQDSPPTREITRKLAIIAKRDEALGNELFGAKLALEQELETEIRPDEMAALIRQAKNGDAISQFILGWAYENGKGFPPDFSESVKWYRIGAEQNDTKSQLNLGFMYFNGRGVAKSFAFAYAWWDIAASNGHADAKMNLDFVSRMMSPPQLSVAKKLSGQLQAKIEGKNHK